ncbi:MAG: Gfo/Idh/MocA family oxidoreductase [Chloroflexota bacterium]|nr:Gfo/Idh/MocA family oxidoreductase [Chloroflexota bacterium]
MNEPIRIGLVGAGRILPAHLRGYQLLRQAGIDNFRIAGITSRTRRDAESYLKRDAGPAPRPPVSAQPSDPLSVDDVFISDLQDEVDVEVLDSLEAMLAAGNVDALDISASLHVHHTAALAGIRAGKHCLVQKPLAISVAAGRAMVEAARQRGVSLGVMENLRYAPRVRVARWLIDNGYLGNLQMIARWSIGTLEWSPDRVVADTPWRHQKLLGGGGATLDIGVHLLHELRYLAGPIDAVSGVTRVFEPIRWLSPAGEQVECDVDDAFFATARLASGAIGQLTFTWAGHGAPSSLPDGLVIYGSRGSLQGDRLTLDDGSATSATELFNTRADARTREAFFPHGLNDAFALAFLDFLNAIAAGRDPEASGNEGLIDLAAAFAICESSMLGRAVGVDEVLSGRVAAYQAPIDQHYGLTERHPPSER